MADDVVHRVAIAGTDMYFDVVEGERILGAALAVSVSVIDPDNPYRYLEVRGVVADIVPDPEFYLHPNDRYDGPLTDTPADAASWCARPRSACTRRRIRRLPRTDVSRRS